MIETEFSLDTLDCPHGWDQSLKWRCSDCRLGRIESLLERLVVVLERQQAIETWQRGEGKHPDD